MRSSDTIGALAAALAAASAEFASWSKAKSAKIKMRAGGEYEYAYADLSSLLAAVRPALSSQGLAVIQTPEESPNGLVLTTTLAHASGEYMTTTLPIEFEGDIKALGSAITYLRRYVLQSMLGLAADDDDGAQVGQRAEPRPRTVGPKLYRCADGMTDPRLQDRGGKPWARSSDFAAWLDATPIGAASYLVWRKSAGKPPLDMDEPFHVGGAWAKVCGQDGDAIAAWLDPPEPPLPLGDS